MHYGAGDFTACIWVNPESQVKQQIFAKRDSASMDFELQSLDDGTIRFFTGPNGDIASLISTGRIPAKARSRVCAVRSAGEVTLYIDGRRDTVAFLPQDTDSPADLHFGRDPFQGEAFSGSMDEPGFSPRARSPGRILLEFRTRYRGQGP